MSSKRSNIRELVTLIEDVQQRANSLLLLTVDEGRNAELTRCPNDLVGDRSSSRGIVGLSEEEQANIDRRLLESMQETDKYRQKYQETERELMTTRRQVIELRDENEALRCLCNLREEEFTTERREHESTRNQLIAVKQELERMRTFIEDRRYVEGRTMQLQQTPRLTMYNPHVQSPMTYYPQWGVDVTDTVEKESSTTATVSTIPVRPSSLADDVRRSESPSADKLRLSDELPSPLTARGSPPPVDDQANDFKFDEAQTNMKLRLLSSDETDLHETLVSDMDDVEFDCLDS